ncbi:MAG: serine/threonine-protein kinase, partial [Myxococcota bacterium]
MQVATPETLAEGRFRLLEVIGEGGMATVYRAFDQRLQRPRAIKVLSPALATRPALRRRFLSEAQTMANLEESRVVRIFDMGEDGERVYIVMELVDGGSLVDRVRDYGPLPPRMAAEATVQICESLQAAHDAGVIHRDIKPHNILLTRNGEIRVTDFGIAQVQSDGDDGHTKTGAVMGTWGFMAPEQKSNAKTVDARADIYSVGATLWSLLTGQTPPELFMAESEPGMLEGLPEELAEVVKRATRYRREDRYVSARAMAESIRALVPMLPEDPELTVPLAPPLLERRGKSLDTMQQFESTAGLAPATMVPTLGGLATA